MGCKNAQHLVVNHTVAGNDPGRGKTERLALQIGDPPARFPDGESAGRHVPRVQPKLPKAVESPGGHVAEVKGCGAWAPDGLSPLDEFGEVVKVVLLGRGDVARESGGQQCVG